MTATTIRRMAPRVRHGGFVAAVALLLAGSSGLHDLRADNLDLELARQAPRIMEHLRQKGYRDVGVLTFRVQEGDKEAANRGTLISGNLADRLEQALILAIDPERPLNVIADARKTARAKWPDASYGTPNDRKRLFDLKYSLPLDRTDRFVSADAFVTGKVSISPDYAKTTVTVEAFDKAQPEKFFNLLTFDVPTDRLLLADLGKGFSISRRYVREMSSDELAVASLKQKTPAEPPVKVTLRYDNQPQSLQRQGGFGQWSVAEPGAGQEVVFDVENVTSEKLAIILTVNGVNTAYEERGLTPEQMWRWVLKPAERCQIKGFYQKDHQNYRPIRGLSDEESIQKAGAFADSAGLIHVYVFRADPKEGKEGADLSQVSAARGNLRKVPPAQVSKRPPRTWDELKRNIAETARSGSNPGRGAGGPGAFAFGRGLAAPGADLRREPLKTDSFDATFWTDTMVIRYWRSAGSPSIAP
jgi:hypothetical protein